MDLNPTYGAQEFVETLSHSSGGGGNHGKKSPSSTTSGSKNNKSSSSNTNSSSKSGNGGGGGHHQHRHNYSTKSGHSAPSSSSYGGGSAASHQSNSNTNAQVDEAYRRLGQRLSMQAHGDVIPRQLPIVAHIQPSCRGAFCPFAEAGTTAMDVDDPTTDGGDGNGDNNTNGDGDDPDRTTSDRPKQALATGRTFKVAKTRYSDHGDHATKVVLRSESLLRKLTVEAKQTFRAWEQAMILHHKQQQQQAQQQTSEATMGVQHNNTNTSRINNYNHNNNNNNMDSKLAPHRYAFSQLSLVEQGGHHHQQQQHHHHLGMNNNSNHDHHQDGNHNTFGRSRHGDSTRSTGEQLGLTWANDRPSHHLHPLHHRGGLAATGGGGGGAVGGGNAMGMGKGLLSAVLEVQSDSNTSASGPAGAEARANLNSPTSQSISTKASTAVSSTNHGNYTSSYHGSHYGGGAGGGSSTQSSAPGTATSSAAAALARGKCLTHPPEPVSNDGYDNVDGNLIVYENDLLVVPRKGMHSVEPKPTRKASEFRVQSLLGQGTFAQVFQCLWVTTGDVVAIKIVKNKPAYTRQATIEIDVFRALMQQQQQQEDSTAGRTQRSSASVVSGGSGAATSASGATEGTSRGGGTTTTTQQKDYMVHLICYFMHRSHLCLVFDLLGLNLYEVLKRRQFRGLPLPIVRSILLQSVEGVKELSQKGIVHCDLKPENILFVSDEAVRQVIHSRETGSSNNTNRTAEAAALTASQQTANATTSKKIVSAEPVGASDDSRGDSMEGGHSSGSSSNAQTIQTGNVAPTLEDRKRSTKLIDFGSACFEGYTAHTYIQSRFYRSPEVLIGLPYDSAIDMWSLGCVAAELFLGLPILPGVHEHDQLCRISEMIAKIPDWMLDQGSKASKFYIKYVARPASVKSPEFSTLSDDGSSAGSGQSSKPGQSSSRISPAPPQTQWRFKTLKEYIVSLSQNDIKKKGGLTKLETQPGNRYFRRKRLPDILALHAQNIQVEDRDMVPAFIHFLYGLLDPDPWKRWTAFQAMHHPFLTGAFHQLRRKTEKDKFDPKDTNHANLDLDYCWKPPWDPAICRRKLLNVQKMREKQQTMRRNMTGARPTTPRGAAQQQQQQRRDHISQNSGLAHPSQQASGISMSRQQQEQPPYNLNQGGSQPSHAYPSRMTSSSLSDLGNPGAAVAQLTLGSPANSVGMQNSDFRGDASAHSFNSACYMPGTGVINQGDLGIALQRPGVVPTAGGESVQSHYSGYSSNHSTGSGGFMMDQSIPQMVFRQQNDQVANNNMSTSLQQSGSVFAQPPMVGNAYGSVDGGANKFSQYMVGGQNMPNHIYTAGQVDNNTTASAASSVTVEVPACQTNQNAYSSGNIQTQQQPPFQQQQNFIQSPQQMYQQPAEFYSQQQQHQQQHPYQQQQQIFPGMQQPQGGFAVQGSDMQYGQPQGMFQAQPPQQQHETAGQMQPQQQALQQQYSIPQQPVILTQANAPGGGFYYVATSANGQPIVLQPVGLLNQHQQGGKQQLQPQYNDPNMQFQQAQMMMQGQQMMMMSPQSFPSQSNGQQQFPQQPQMQQQQPQYMMEQQFMQQQSQGSVKQGMVPIHDQNRRNQASPRKSNARNQRRPYGGGGTSM